VIVGAFNGSILIIVALFALVWALFLRPQQARQRAAREQGNTIAPGDEVLTVGGIYGIVQDTDEEGDLIVEIAEGIHVRVARRAVATVVKPEEDGEDEDSDAEQEAEPDADEAAPDTNPPAA
jgi:preprotein translocase subunit YajC